ncbi:PE family protein [Mycobacterium angelicum]|uniref:PE family protein n=1 Tax=Mycobacterium angelicum TaxID=470074 RepID=UPI0021F360CE|nr:PE family protein [Mycobacterium angelicum]
MIASSELMTSAATDLTHIRSSITTASAAEVTQATQLMTADADDVSVLFASLFTIATGVGGVLLEAPGIGGNGMAAGSLIGDGGNGGNGEVALISNNPGIGGAGGTLLGSAGRNGLP